MMALFTVMDALQESARRTSRRMHEQTELARLLQLEQQVRLDGLCNALWALTVLCPDAAGRAACQQASWQC
jgi:hypothetical protein